MSNSLQTIHDAEQALPFVRSMNDERRLDVVSEQRVKLDTHNMAAGKIAMLHKALFDTRGNSETSLVNQLQMGDVWNEQQREALAAHYIEQLLKLEV